MQDRQGDPGLGDQAARDIVDVDEVSAGLSAVLQRQCLAVQRFPDEGRRDIAPDRVRRAAPLPEHKRPELPSFRQ